MESGIDVQGVRKAFGRREVLREVTLSVPRGATFGFLGRNGQGKTTTIRMLLGLLTPDAGTIRVEGRDPAREALAVRRHVGYLAEDQQMFGWMTVQETIRFLRPFYSTWDDALVARLLERFELAHAAKVKHLSKGQNVRLGLLLALAHRPPVVILDDPTLGLDPIMRKEFMRDVIEHLQAAGVTTFFSSHMLYEIEPVADFVAILDRGTIVRQARTEELREDVRQFVLESEAAGRVMGSAGMAARVLDAKDAGRRTGLIVTGAEAFGEELTREGIAAEQTELNLDEIFEAYVIGNRGERAGAAAKDGARDGAKEPAHV